MNTFLADETTQELIHELERTIVGEVRFDAFTRMLYSTDASLYQIQPVGVVIPRSTEDVQAAVEIAVRHRLPILPRGGGSSLAGQAVGAALVIDFSKYLNQILAIDSEAGAATVQPGILIGVLNRQLAKHGLMLGPDPASAERATVGGSVGNNATGSHSILYGMMADNVIAARAVLSDSSLAHFVPVHPDDLPALGRSDTLTGRIYRQVPALLAENLDEMRARWPKHWRRASGYNLDRLAAALLAPEERRALSFASPFRPAICDPQRIDRFNLAQLLTGSEGTLAVLSEVTLKLVKRPKQTAVAVVHFDHILEACAAITAVLECQPSASELLDKQLMDLARQQSEWARRMNFVDGDPAAVLLTEFYGEDEADLRRQIDHLAGHLTARGWKGVIRRVFDKADQTDLWTVRKAGLNLLTSRRGDFKPVPGIEDVSIPAEHLADYLGQVLDWRRTRPGIPDIAVYAHASAGCLHVRPLINVKTQEGVDNLQAMADFATELCLRYGGALSGEHGDGLMRSALNPRLFGPQLYAALQATKRLFDPNGLMNPGKIVDAPPLTENLRMGPGYQTIQLTTVFDWRGDHGFAGAIEMCNGAGVCRKLENGMMCPSFMVTRDERDSTRARANALRNALAGRIPHEALFSPEMAGVMDLCLGCKACKSECPSSVDLAKIKAEFLVHYYRRNDLPLFNRLMGWLPALNALLYRLAKMAPFSRRGAQEPGLIRMTNAIVQSQPFRRLQSTIGVTPQRALPRYAPAAFADWFRARSQPSAFPAMAPTVVLFHDTWTNFNEPQVGQAALRILEAAGYRVVLAEGRKCCGRPLITGGQADRAKAWVDHNVALLAPYAAQGVAIVGLEPSCILTLRDEYLTLASDSKRTKLLAQHAFTFEEFIVGEAKAGRFTVKFQPQAGKALLHGHCHHKALVGNEVSVAALKLAGYVVEVIPSGCCGMAGDFGYELNHYELSGKIGEDRLFPAVRQAEVGTVLVASGTSCRHQIEHFTQRQPLHLAEALAKVLASR
jgi:FAD/FMN-containing dehydrogenase/Fe-S oxidoreductase